MPAQPIDPACAQALEHNRRQHFEGTQEMFHFWSCVRYKMLRQAQEYDPQIHDRRIVIEPVDHVPTQRFLHQLWADGRLGEADTLINLAAGMPLFRLNFTKVLGSSNLAPEFNINLRWG